MEEALRIAEAFIAKLSKAVCGNTQLPEHGEFYRGYNAVTTRVRTEATQLLPVIRAALAKAEMQRFARSEGQ